jgi:hypothetical protein
VVEVHSQTQDRIKAIAVSGYTWDWVPLIAVSAITRYIIVIYMIHETGLY